MRSTEDVVYSKNQTDNIGTDPNFQFVVALPSPVLSTPLKQNPNKRRSSAIDKPEQRPRFNEHRPQVLHEAYTSEIFTLKPHVRRSVDRKKSSKPLSKNSNDVGIRQAANKSCKRALKFDLENKDRCKILEDNECQGLNLDLEKKREKQLLIKYQRRKKRMGNIGVNMETGKSARFTEMDCLSVMDASVTLSKGVVCDFIKPKRRIQRVSPRLREILMKETGCEHLFSVVYSRKVKVKQCLEHTNESGEKISVMNRKEKTGRQGVKTAEAWLRKRNGKKVVKNRQRKLQPLQYFTPYYFVDVVIIKLESLTISENYGQDMLQTENVESSIVSCKETFDLVKKHNLQALVDIDEESERVYNMLMSNGGNSYDAEAEADSEKKQYWATQRELTKDRVNSFMSALREIQGDRSFSQWKGSVLDSIVGAYLTQNVTDHASSSAFMSLAARYPAQNSHVKINIQSKQYLILLGEKIKYHLVVVFWNK